MERRGAPAMTTSMRAGIDLGTTNSVIAHVVDGRPVAVVVEEHAGAVAPMPSCVAVAPDGTLLVGTPAAAAADHAREFKRHIGEDVLYALGTRSLRPIELSALVLRRLREGYEERHGALDGVVVTVPAMFDELQRRETIEAAAMAGLKVLRLVNEPSAAAIAYALDDPVSPANTLVVDWGGGTLDVSLVEGDGTVLDVVRNDGDTRLGGRDLDQAVARALLATLGDAAHVVRGDRARLAALVRAAERAKIALTDAPTWCESFQVAPGDVRDLALTRARLEDIAAPLVARVLHVVDRMLASVPGRGLAARDVADVVLVGGACRLPLVQRRLAEHCGVAPRTSLDPMEVVALGAAYQAAHAESSRAAGLITLHALTMHLGVRSRGVDRAGVVRDDLFTCLLAAGTKIPATARKTFATSHDAQTEVDIEVHEMAAVAERIAGHRPWDVRRIGGLPARRAGEVTIEVTFRYRVDQTLEVRVDIPAANISERWIPARQQALDERRDAGGGALGSGPAPLDD